jgi:hypothetical protein
MTEFLKSVLGDYKPFEFIHGTGNRYIVIGKVGDNKVAIHIEAGTGAVPYKGNKLATTGLALRLIEIGEDSLLGKAFGHRGHAQFATPDGEVLEGHRLIKTFLPVTNYPTSGATFHKFLAVALPKLATFIKEKLEGAGGKLTISLDELETAMKCNLDLYDNPDLDLFHLPGQKPDWLEAKKPEPPAESGN